MKNPLNRRRFLRQTTTLGAGSFMLGAAPFAFASARASTDKLRLACIGIGRRGGVNLKAVAGEEIVALCDVDEQRLNEVAATVPNARKYFDFRKLLEQEKHLDGVVISTPDHCHAPIALMAMKLGIHVYCEKPLTHTIGEARLLTETAARAKAITQMGTDSQSARGYLDTVELVEAGAIGEVKEVHVWSNRPAWPQGQDRPRGADPVPPWLKWDLWLGPAAARPYKAAYDDPPLAGKAVYHPFVWRGWWDFGCGALGDMAPHLMNVAFRALHLGAPVRVEAQSSGMKPEAFPSWSIIRFEFAATDKRPGVTIIWYDGGKHPPAELFDGAPIGENCFLFVGSKGKIYSGEKRTRDAEPVLLPAKTFAGYQRPTPTWTRFGEVHEDWLRAIRAGDSKTACPFSYGGPMTEAYLLGNIALRVGQPIQWDPLALKVTNCREANQYLNANYREGWKV